MHADMQGRYHSGWLRTKHLQMPGDISGISYCTVSMWSSQKANLRDCIKHMHHAPFSLPCVCAHIRLCVILLSVCCCMIITLVTHSFQLYRICHTLAERIYAAYNSIHHGTCILVRFHALHSKWIRNVHFTHNH